MTKPIDCREDEPTSNLLVIEDYSGGYRPTATGKIGGRLFYFRWAGNSWSFGVSTEAAASGTFWWHSPMEDFSFEAHGEGSAVWHSDSLPTFVEVLRRYLASHGSALPELDAIVQEARRQANALFNQEKR